MNWKAKWEEEKRRADERWDERERRWEEEKRRTEEREMI
jgi:hypothetical protein